MSVVAAQISVTAVATKLSTTARSAGRSKASITIANVDASVDVFLGGSGVTAAAGFKLVHGTAAVTFQIGPNDDIYAITATGTAAVAVIQVGV
jgi:hypothetical protein